MERNTAFERQWNFGDIDKGFKESDYVREDRFTTSIVMHGFIEPTACVALWEPSDKYTFWVCNQMPFTLRRDLAQALSMPQGKIRIIKINIEDYQTDTMAVVVPENEG